MDQQDPRVYKVQLDHKAHKDPQDL
jgi:hypothetical protein